MSLAVIQFRDPYTSQTSNLMNSVIVDDEHVVYVIPTYLSDREERISRYNERLSRLVENYFDGVTPTDATGWTRLVTFNNSSIMTDVTSKKNYTDFDSAVASEQEEVDQQYLNRLSAKASTPEDEEKIMAMTEDFLHEKQKRATK